MEVGTVVFFCNPGTTIPEDGFILELASAFSGLDVNKKMRLQKGQKVWLLSKVRPDLRACSTLAEITDRLEAGRYRFRCGQVTGDLNCDWEGYGDDIEEADEDLLERLRETYPDRFKRIDEL